MFCFSLCILSKQRKLSHVNVYILSNTIIIIVWGGCLPIVLRPAQEFFTYTETSPLPVKGCKNLGLRLALKAFEQGGTYLMPHLL
jgi:hypothetical protein